MLMCGRDEVRREDIGVPGRSREWYDGTRAPASGLQVDGNKATAEQPRLLGPDGNPAPRTVHGFGFRAAMVTQED